MFALPRFTNAREIQRNYRRLFDEVRKTKRPLVVLRDNKPDVAIVDIKILEEWEAIGNVLKSTQQAKTGKTKRLTSLVDLWYESQKS